MKVAISRSRRNVLFLTQFSVLLAVEIVFCFTPLGSIPIGPMVATLSMVPVILTAQLMGVGAGAAMGFAFGICSFLVWTFMPTMPAVAFLYTPFYSFGGMSGNGWSLVICFVPRILAGLVVGASFRGLARALPKKPVLQYGISAALGSLVNTFLVLGGVYVFFGRPYAAVIGEAYEVLLWIIGGTVVTNGIPEAVIAFLVGAFVARPVKGHLGHLLRG